MVKENQFCFCRSGDARNLLNLARANQRRRVGLRPPLQDLGGNFATGARYQLAKLCQRLLGIQARSIQCASATTQLTCNRLRIRTACPICSFSSGSSRKARAREACTSPSRVNTKVHSYQDRTFRSNT